MKRRLWQVWSNLQEVLYLTVLRLDCAGEELHERPCRNEWQLPSGKQLCLGSDS